MNDSVVSNFQADLRIRSGPIIFILLALGSLSSLAGGTVADVEVMRPIITAFWGMGALSWALIRWKPNVGLWFLIAALIAIIQIINVGLNLPLALTLLAIPAAVAVGLLGFSGAVIVGVVETIALGLVWGLQAAGSEPGVILIAAIMIWSILGVLWAIEQRIQYLAHWSWEQNQQASALIDEVRSQRAEREQALTDLAHANRQLVVLNEKLGAMRVMAEEAQKSKTDFVVNVSHEFRTPLNMIIGLVDLLLEAPGVYGDNLPPALLQDLEIVHRNCEHLGNMINDVLDLSQVEAGKLALHRERVNLTEVIERALTIVHPLVDKKRLSLKVDLPNDLPEVYCDRTRIRQVIVNLLSNAARLTERGGLIVCVKQETEEITVSISDTGPGISPEDTEKIFLPFFRGTPGIVAGQTGSGMGLTISKQFAEQHGGRMWLDSVVGVGSTFHFTLPISPPLPISIKPGAHTREEWLWRERSTRPILPREPFRRRIVICDESRELVPLFSRYSDEIEFVDCQNLAATVAQVHQSDAQAVMINAIQVQDLQGEVEKARRELPDVPIIGCSLPPRREEALRAGALSYLFKPVLRADLERALAQIIKPVRRVLIVDDNSDARQIFTRMVYACNGSLEVQTAATGKEALEAMGMFRPDVVLLDIILPDLDGWHVLAKMHEDPALRDIPTIFVSAQDPAERPLRTRMLMAAMGDGISISKLLHCLEMLSAILLQPVSVHDPMPGQTPAV